MSYLVVVIFSTNSHFVEKGSSYVVSSIPAYEWLSYVHLYLYRWVLSYQVDAQFQAFQIAHYLQLYVDISLFIVHHKHDIGRCFTITSKNAIG